MSSDFIVYETCDIEIYKDEKVTFPQGQKVIKCKDDNSYFVLGKTLGEGSFSKVKIATRHWEDESGTSHEKRYAVKIMHKPSLKRQRCVMYDESNTMTLTNNLEKVMTEINIWRQLNNENIIRLYEIIDDPTHDYMYLILEYAESGQIMTWDSASQHYLYNDKVIQTLQEKHPDTFRKFPIHEAAAKIIFSQMIQAIKFMQSEELRIVHNDVKPENILFVQEEGLAKLTDFTVSKQMSSLTAQCFEPGGTVPFQSKIYTGPESMFSGQAFNPFQADLWSFAVCIYTFLANGRLPWWDSEYEIHTQLKIQQADPEYPENFSNEVRNLLEGILKKNPSDRLGLNEILAHPWLNNL